MVDQGHWVFTSSDSWSCGGSCFHCWEGPDGTRQIKFLPLGICRADGGRMEPVQRGRHRSCLLAVVRIITGAWPLTWVSRDTVSRAQPGLLLLAKAHGSQSRLPTERHKERKQLRQNSKEDLYIEHPGGPWPCEKLAIQRLKSLRRTLEIKNRSSVVVGC